MKKVFLIISLLFAFLAGNSQTVTPITDTVGAVRDIFYDNSGEGYYTGDVYPGIKKDEITNVSIVGSVGYSENLGIGVGKGLVLTTGKLEDVLGDVSDVSSSASNNYADTMIERMLYMDSALDIAYLKFDIIPYSDTLIFSMAFASEEYPECLEGVIHNNEKVDRMGVFISGRNPNGTDSTGAETDYDSLDNMGLLPNGTEIWIKQIFFEDPINPGQGANVNYYDNDRFGNTLAFDGLIADMSQSYRQWIDIKIPVVPCGDEVYTVFIVVADESDTLNDSAVLLKAGSLRTNARKEEVDAEEISVELFEDVIVCPEFEDYDTLYAKAEGKWGFYNYTWSAGTAGIKDSLNAITSLDESMYVNVTVTDVCENEAISNDVYVKLQCPLRIPNVFTPYLKDKKNDRFEVENIDEYKDVTMVIYNRYGKKVYESIHYENENQWWDGGKHPPGSYFYVLKLKIEGREIVKKGLITIIN